jgi:nucleotide-binding universal stress UspA family protein
VHTQFPLYEVGAGIVTLTQETEREVEKQEERYLEEIAGQLRASGLAVSTEVVKGAIVPTLADYAERHGIGLVVMSSHGRGGIRRAVLGSVTDQLLRMVSLPVLIVTPGMAPRIDDGWPRRVLLPLDGSALGGSAIHALDLVDPLRCSRLLLTTVIPASIPALSPWGYQFEPWIEASSDEEDRLQAHLAQTTERLRVCGYRARSRVMNGGKVAREILKLAIGWHCDMIVMATHGAGGLDRVMFGSVTDQVVRHSSIPVLVVRPTLEETELTGRRPEPAFATAGA